MLEFDLLSGPGERNNLAETVDDAEKAKAFLKILDASISGVDGATIPMDLSSALDQIREVAPAVAKLPSFLRLSALARRV